MAGIGDCQRASRVRLPDALVLLRDAPVFAIPPRYANKARAKPLPVKDTIRGCGMHINPKEGHKDMDYAEHMATYTMFCKFTLWSVIILAALMAAMGYFLT